MKFSNRKASKRYKCFNCKKEIRQTEKYYLTDKMLWKVEPVRLCMNCGTQTRDKLEKEASPNPGKDSREA